ncbi:membrane protein [Endozoicomonas numazuensis]|uniref:Membrane protein n=1 Tax=Endozoicomonas numazuensis TaxID=1137799 RepID=A0A081NH05_9GAMM|nr:membrane protein [Endozoicomonas numazuensis]
MSGIASWFDWFALLSLIVLWVGYTVFAYRKGQTTACLASVLALYRRDWMYRLLGRDNRIADASLLSSLRASVSFFASTSILVMAGLITGIAASEEAVGVLSTMPFVTTYTRELWELKVLVMLIIFVYTFFEFTWSLRLYNFTCVLMGSAPLMHDISGNKTEQKVFADKAGHILTLAANHFNYGLRAYYFALATLSWFIHPSIFIISTIMVVVILYRREFHSKVLDALSVSERE